MIDPTMNSEAATAIERELGPDERLLWYGSPRSGILFQSSDIFFVPFSLLWGGFAFFWMAMAVFSGAPFFFVLFGLPFVLVGLYMIAGRFFVDAYVRERTYYGVTNERAIISSGLFNRTVNSISLRTLTDFSVEERADGSGNIVFGTPTPFATWVGNSAWINTRRYTPPAFQLIPAVRDVAALIRDAQRRITATQAQTDGTTRSFG